MFYSVGVCASLLTTLLSTSAEAKTGQYYNADQALSDSHTKGLLHEDRNKRSVFGLGIKAFIAWKARNKLLDGAELVWEKMGTGTREFVKKGDYFKAIDEFFSVKPHGVRDLELPGGEEGIMGFVGDSAIIIRKRGVDNSAQMSITKNKKDYPEYIIRYNNK